MFKQSRLGWFLVLAMCVLSLGSVAGAQEGRDYTDGLNIPDVVAKVNGAAVRSEFIKFKFNRVMARLEADLHQRPDGDQLMQKMMQIEERKKAVVDLIDKEIIRELMHQEAKKSSKMVDPKIIDAELGRIRDMYKSKEEFAADLKRRKLTEEGLRSNLGIDSMIQQLVQERIEGKITIADDQVQKFYEENKERFQRPEAYHTRHIFLPHFTKEMFKNVSKEQMRDKEKEFSAQAEANMKSILKKIRDGADFVETAKKYSKDEATASKGGDLEFIYKGVFPPTFDEAVGKLKPQEVSDVVKTPFGYHIIQLLETKAPDTAPFEDLKESIQKHLFVQEGQKQLQAYVDDLRKKADVEMMY